MSAGETPAGERFWSVIKLDLADPDHETDFHRWYESIHLPDLVHRPGYERAWRTGECEDGPEIGPDAQEFWAIYQVDDADLFGQPAPWTAEPDAPALDVSGLAWTTNFGRVLYRLEAEASGTPGEGAYWVREEFDIRGDDTSGVAFRNHITEEYLPEVLAMPGVRRAWWLERVPSEHQAGVAPAGDHMIVFEIDAPADLLAAERPELAVGDHVPDGTVVIARALHLAKVLFRITH